MRGVALQSRLEFAVVVCCGVLLESVWGVSGFAMFGMALLLPGKFGGAQTS